MSEQDYMLEPELIGPLAAYVCREIQHSSLALRVEQAFTYGGAYIRLDEGDNRYLVVSHRNGRIYVHVGYTRGHIEDAKSFKYWDDTYLTDRAVLMLALDGLGVLWQPSGEGRCDATLLQLTNIDIQPFIDGYRSALAAAAV